jgi:hypothetical protein
MAQGNGEVPANLIDPRLLDPVHPTTGYMNQQGASTQQQLTAHQAHGYHFENAPQQQDAATAVQQTRAEAILEARLRRGPSEKDPVQDNVPGQDGASQGTGETDRESQISATQSDDSEVSNTGSEPGAPSDIQLQYADGQAVIDAQRAEVLFPGQPQDPTIPRTNEDVQANVKDVVAAIKNTHGITAKGNEKAFQTRWGKGAQYYSDSDFEQLAWELVIRTIHVHQNGWTQKIWDGNISAEIKKTAGWSFQLRMEHITGLLKLSKRTCEDLLKREKLSTVIGMPKKLAQSVHANKTSNDQRGDHIKAGRPLVPRKPGSRRAQNQQNALQNTAAQSQQSENSPGEVGAPAQPESSTAAAKKRTRDNTEDQDKDGPADGTNTDQPKPKRTRTAGVTGGAGAATQTPAPRPRTIAEGRRAAKAKGGSRLRK